jgi:hypothetical protein
MAGGQIPLRNIKAEQLAEELREQALRHLKVPPDVQHKPLI